LREWLLAHPEDHAVFGSPASAGVSHSDWAAAEKAILTLLPSGCLVKAPLGTSGTQNKRVLNVNELQGPLGGWIQNSIREQGSVVVEPWLDKHADLSMQLEISDEGVRLLGIRRFYVGSRLEYRGTELDPKLTSLDEEAQRFLHSDPGPIERWKTLARAVGQELARSGYRGPAGIDALLWKEKGGLRLKPLVELNPRWTMGRVALAIEAHVLPGTPARWLYVSKRALAAGQGFVPFAEALEARHPVSRKHAGGGMRICEGIVCTTDPTRAREVLTVLAVGPHACSDPLLRLPD
jgi:hypothetical protein